MTTINQPNRRSIRLHGYDYSQAGMCFVTLCTQSRECLFGHINDGIMVLNDAGQMVEKWYYEIGNKFPDIICHDMVIMPNHMHFVIENVGADLCVCPNKTNKEMGEHVTGEHVGSPLRRIVQWFKTMSTNEYIRGVKVREWIPFDKKLWQRNYYEHIIRNQEAYSSIADYIINNPNKWNTDENNMDAKP